MSGARGMEWLQVGTDDEAELVLVPALPAPPQPCLCRWHQAARFAVRCTWPAGWAVQGLLCSLRGHRLTKESRDVDGENLTLYCWCARRYQYVGDEAAGE